MNMRFNSLTCSNFMSFESCSIDLLGNGFVKVVGQNNNKTDNSKSNGSGKSAIWEALSWCLTGSTLRGSKDIVRHPLVQKIIDAYEKFENNKGPERKKR